MALKVAVVSAMMMMFIRILSMVNTRPMGQGGTSMMASSYNTPGIIRRGPSCAVGEYDAELGEGIQTLTYEEMYNLIKYNRSEFELVDVRGAQAYADGHLPTAFLVSSSAGKFPDHVDFRQIMCGRKYVVLYCSSGRRAMAAANTLRPVIPVKVYSGSWREWSAKNPLNVVE